MTTLSIAVDTNFTNQDLTGVDLIEFTNGLGKSATATFKGSQLDAGLLPGLKIEGSNGVNIIVINNAAKHSIFDQPFDNWGADDRVVLNGNDNGNVLRSIGGNDRFFGFGGDDVFVVNRSFIEISGGADDDLIKLQGDGMSIASGAIIKGGANFDVLQLGPGIASILQADMSSVEKVKFSAADGVDNIFSLNSAQIGQGLVREVEGSASADTFNIIAHIADVSALKFSNWSGNDLVSINGFSDDDTIAGTSRADFIRPIGGNDHVEGRGGGDTLNGGTGDDLLLGQAGADLLIGEGGADTFYYESATHSRGKRFDTIADFNRNTDKVDLTTIDANSTAAGDDAFTFIGEDPFSGVAGELRYRVNAQGVRILGDVDGDKAADFAIQMNELTKVGDLDFFL